MAVASHGHARPMKAAAGFVESAGKGYVRLRSGKDDVFERNAVPRIQSACTP
jgi:hypothetical protein